MPFLSKEQIKDIVDGGVYKCGAHDFICDVKDKASIQKHESDNTHYLKGHSPCQRCGIDTAYNLEDKVPQPKVVGKEPGAFCKDCKAELKKELFGSE